MFREIIATFIGQDGSRGFRTGQTYRLAVRKNEIVRLDDTGRCPYSSLESFLRNWTNIVVVK